MVERIYLLTNQEDKVVAKANLSSPLDLQTVQFEVLSERGEGLQVGQTLRFIGNNEGDPDFAGEIQSRKEKRIVVRSTAPLDKSARKNLRVDVDFNGLLYPVSGAWKGQRTIRGIDLSCGGVAFYCTQKLQVGEVAEIVLPMTTNPLLLKVQIMRIREANGPLILYAGRFVDMIHDEETLVRRAVFDVQLQSAR